MLFRAWRAYAAAARTCWPTLAIAFEPPWPPVFTARQPSVTVPMMTPFLSFTVEPYVIWAMLMSSSSAAIIRKPVGVPLPISTWLVNRLAVLSGLISMNESTWFVGGYCEFGDGTMRRRVRARGTREAEADDEPAAGLHERLARELLVEHLGHGYFPPFAITAAAFWIAVRIRGYVPHRQRWPFIAVRICASVGRFVVASRSAAWIIIPFWQ